MFILDRAPTDGAREVSKQKLPPDELDARHEARAYIPSRAEIERMKAIIRAEKRESGEVPNDSNVRQSVLDGLLEWIEDEPGEYDE